jgi:hypothetical protein
VSDNRVTVADFETLHYTPSIESMVGLGADRDAPRQERCGARCDLHAKSWSAVLLISDSMEASGKTKDKLLRCAIDMDFA